MYLFIHTSVNKVNQLLSLSIYLIFFKDNLQFENVLFFQLFQILVAD